MPATYNPLDLEAAFRRSISRPSIGTMQDAAARLGVTREHLSRVLHGHRQSVSLTRRFRELETQAAKP